MKKVIASILLICVIFTLCACNGGNSATVIENTFSLADTPIVEEGSKFLDTNGAETIDINFTVPES